MTAGRPYLGQGSGVLQAKHSSGPRGLQWPCGRAPDRSRGWCRQARSPVAWSSSPAPSSHTEVGPSGPGWLEGRVPPASLPPPPGPASSRGPPTHRPPALPGTAREAVRRTEASQPEASAAGGQPRRGLLERPGFLEPAGLLPPPRSGVTSLCPEGGLRPLRAKAAWEQRALTKAPVYSQVMHSVSTIRLVSSNAMCVVTGKYW